jgi:hypothetical protein
LVLASCGATGELSDADALSAIRDAAGYPCIQVVTLSHVPEKSSLGKEIARLVREGLLVPKAGREDDYEPTNKGKQLVSSASFNPVGLWRDWTFVPYGHRIDATRILDRRFEKEKDIAIVEYEVLSEQTQYGAQLQKLAPDLATHFAGNTKRGTAAFQKWESGWRLIAGVEKQLSCEKASEQSKPTEPDVEIKLVRVSTGWLDMGIVNNGENKLVPSVSMTVEPLTNASTSRIRLKAIFRRVGTMEQFGEQVADIEGSVVVLQAANGYTSPMPRAQMLKSDKFVDADVQVLAQRGSDAWMVLGNYPVERRLVTP